LVNGDAPADRYFGRMGMSALRIRYETMQLKVRYEKHELLPEQTEHLLDLTDDAFEQWAKAYPKDSWLASTGYAIANLYAELPGTAARDRAVALFVYVKSHFASSPYATSSRQQLHRGVSVKPDPAWAKNARAATPAPSPATTLSPLPSQPPRWTEAPLGEYTGPRIEFAS
jgi:hypothetical protein